MVAKMLDIPSVVVRTDFRAGGDSRLDPWNLMVSGYPRTKILLADAIARYQNELRVAGTTPVEAGLAATRSFAQEIVQALDEVRAMQPVLTPSLREHIFQWMRHFPGESFSKLLSAETTQSLISSKVSRGLL